MDFTDVMSPGGRVHGGGSSCAHRCHLWCHHAVWTPGPGPVDIIQSEFTHLSVNFFGLFLPFYFFIQFDSVSLYVFCSLVKCICVGDRVCCLALFVVVSELKSQHCVICCVQLEFQCCVYNYSMCGIGEQNVCVYCVSDRCGHIVLAFWCGGVLVCVFLPLSSRVFPLTLTVRRLSCLHLS